MAVTANTPSLKVSIVVNNAAVQEYDDDEGENSSSTVTKYIEAVSGAEFAIRSRFNELQKHDVAIDVYLDGKYASGSYALLDRFEGSFLSHTSRGVSSNEGRKWQLQKYAFSDLQTVDSDGRAVADHLIKDLEHMGEITVHFHHVTNPRPSVSAMTSPSIDGSKGVPEKALKGRALTHRSTLRAPEPTTAGRFTNTDYVDPKKIPFAEFHFKYRSRDGLKALMIIPRSPSPQPLEDRDVDTLSPEEMRQLLRRQRDRDQAAQVVKQERGVKRERSRERSSTAYDFNGDDDEVSFVSVKRARHPVIIDEDGSETIDLT